MIEKLSVNIFLYTASLDGGYDNVCELCYGTVIEVVKNGIGLMASQVAELNVTVPGGQTWSETNHTHLPVCTVAARGDGTVGRCLHSFVEIDGSCTFVDSVSGTLQYATGILHLRTLFFFYCS